MTDVIAEIKLTKPLEAPSGDKLETLTLNQPKAGDVIKIGQPVAVEFLDGKISAKADPAKIAAYLPACTGQPQIILEGMALDDTFHMLGELEVFFTERAVEMAARMFSQRQEEQPESLPSSETNPQKASVQ